MISNPMMTLDSFSLELFYVDDIKLHEEYFPYLRCLKCSMFLNEPKNCTKCNATFCSKCQRLSCTHTQTVSRHLKSILETLKFRCKFKDSG